MASMLLQLYTHTCVQQVSGVNLLINQKYKI